MCHGQMIWVRAIGVLDANTQVSGRAFEDARSIIGPEPIRAQAHPVNEMAHQTTLTPGVYYPAVHCGVCGVCGAAEIPQRHYRSAPLSPDPTYENGEVITFSGGGDCGVNIVDAAEYRLSNLFGGDDLMFVNATVSTFSVRIEWPGYKMWTGQFRARSWGGTSEPVTRSRLAMQIAKRTIDFLEAMEDVESTDMAWKIGRGHITARDLVLVSLAQVSKGSWQPLLRLIA